jgi:hypothetical protein
MASTQYSFPQRRTRFWPTLGGSRASSRRRSRGWIWLAAALLAALTAGGCLQDMDGVPLTDAGVFNDGAAGAVDAPIGGQDAEPVFPDAGQVADADVGDGGAADADVGDGGAADAAVSDSGVTELGF